MSEKIIKNHSINYLPLKRTYNTCKSVYKYKYGV